MPSSKRRTPSTTHPTPQPSCRVRPSPRRASPRTTPTAPRARGTRRPAPPRSLSAVSSATRYASISFHIPISILISAVILRQFLFSTEPEAVRTRAEPRRAGAGGARAGQGLHVGPGRPRVGRRGQRRRGPDGRPRQAGRVPEPARRRQDAAARRGARHPEAGRGSSVNLRLLERASIFFLFGDVCLIP